ncbi:MAG: T9SS type A sorting domain-containing protein [Bacteroidales bacterium]|nr:T9SS type A sorting domain-containing protein [Bacteroidales bacterium]
MRKFIVPFCILPWLIQAQIPESSYLKENPNLNLFHQIKTMGNLTIVIDSVVNYSYSTMWAPIFKTYVISRHSSGMPHQLMEDVYDVSTQSWTHDIYMQENFFPNNHRNEYCKKRYNKFIGVFKDTTEYLKLLPYLNPFGDTMSLVSLNAYYNINTQAIENGNLMKAQVYHDSLYQNLTVYQYNAATSKYDMPLYDFDFSYNNLNQIQLVTKKIWNSSANQFENYIRIYYQYNSNQKLCSQIIQTFNSSWKNYEKYEYEYDPSGNNICKKYYKSNNANQFIANTMDSTYYDGNHNVIKKIKLKWDQVINQWIYFERTTISYAQNLITLILNETWNGTQWIPSNRYTYTYNPANKISTNEFEYYSTSWKKNWKETYTYDVTDTNLLMHNTFFSYDFINYTPNSKEIYVLNSFKEDSIYYYLIYNLTTNQWDSISKKEYYWSTWNANSVTEIFPAPISIFPNPCKDWCNVITSFPTDRLEIYDRTGKVLYSEEKTNDQFYSILVSQYKSGIYFMVVTDLKGKRFSCPIIKL